MSTLPHSHTHTPPAREHTPLACEFKVEVRRVELSLFLGRLELCEIKW
jgi:hypothetical protein